MSDEVGFFPCRWTFNCSTCLYQQFEFTWLSMPKAPKITSLQYLKKDLRDKVDFLPADEHSFLQVDTIIFNGLGQVCAKFPK